MNIEVGSLFANLSAKGNKAFHKYGFIVIFLIVATGALASLYMLNLVIKRTDSAEGYSAPASTYTFDASTIEKIKSLKSNNESSTPVDTSSTDRLLPF